jgi:hypothetical protein
MWEYETYANESCIVFRMKDSTGIETNVIEIVPYVYKGSRLRSIIVSNSLDNDFFYEEIFGHDLDVLKFKSLIKANELGWEVDLTKYK